MDSHLRAARKAKKMTLKELQKALLDIDHEISIGYLSLLECGKVWPSRDVVAAVVKVFGRKLNEMKVLYPYRGIKGEK